MAATRHTHGTPFMAFTPFRTGATGLLPGVEELAKRGVRITGLAPGNEGVEMKARDARNAFVGPQDPNLIVNGGRPYSGAKTAAPVPLPSGGGRPAVALPGNTAAPDLSRFGVGIATRGGPMQYSQRGVGTTNPNSFRVGANRKSIGQRVLERLARRGNIQAAGQLAGQDFQRGQSAEERAHTTTRDSVKHGYDLEIYGEQNRSRSTEAEQDREYGRERDGNQERIKEEEYARRRRDEVTDRDVSMTPVPLPNLKPGDAPVMINGQVVRPPTAEAPAPAPSLIPIPGTNERVPMLGDQRIPGPNYVPSLPGWGEFGPEPGAQFVPKPEPAKEPKEPKWEKEGGIEDPKTKTMTPVRHFRIVPDEKRPGKFRKDYLDDETDNGPETKPGEKKPAPTWTGWLKEKLGA